MRKRVAGWWGAGIGLAIASLVLAWGAAAQSPPEANAPAATAAPRDTKPARAKIDAFRLDLEQKEAALARPNIPDADLQSLRQATEAIAQELRTILDELGPRLDAARARLEQLGPKPKEGAPEESADVARDRLERESATAELDETQRLGRALLVQAEQLAARIGERRRAAFAHALFERGFGIFSPDLWSAVTAQLPRDGVALRIVFADWLARIRANARPGVLLLVGLAIGVALALYLGREFIAPRLVARDPAAIEVSRRRRILTALGVLLIGAGPAAAGSFVVFAALGAVDLMPARVRPFAATLLGGLAFIAFARALADAILAPGRGLWRLVPLDDAPAERSATFAVAFASVVASGKVVEALYQAIAAALPLTVATRGLFALAAALILAELLRRFAQTATAEEACLGPYIPTGTAAGGSIRIIGWIAVAAVIAAVVIGYIAFASFLVDQIVWVSVIAGLLLLAIVLADELIAGALKGESRISTTLQANTGLRRRSLEQIGVLANGLVRLVLVTGAVILALAPWGVDTADLASALRSAFFGFKVGDVTISLAAIVVALLIFGLGLAVTRIIQSWLDTTFLPATDLDAGLRNSIRTAFGYLGFFAAAAFALTYLGLGLDKIAIIAGALSVGIGFGLQSIVNNFVSGLILLWERPIRVGDLVVVGDGEGVVRKISVRATEIETFDRSTIIVPNSNLISGVVRNRVRASRTGRVIVAVNVLRNQDPVRAAELLTACAERHPEVVRTPPPRVLFKKIGDTWLEFDLVCYIADVSRQQHVQSDLNFALFKALSDEGIMPPLGPAPTSAPGLGPVEAALEHIAEAIATARRGETPAPASIEAGRTP